VAWVIGLIFAIVVIALIVYAFGGATSDRKELNAEIERIGNAGPKLLEDFAAWQRESGISRIQEVHDEINARIDQLLREQRGLKDEMDRRYEEGSFRSADLVAQMTHNSTEVARLAVMRYKLAMAIHEITGEPVEEPEAQDADT
jgi:hypothetical protein